MALFREDSMAEIAKVAGEIGEKALVHIKVDTGMGRIGVRCDEMGIDFSRDFYDKNHTNLYYIL